jgi:hypothetical protein
VDVTTRDVVIAVLFLVIGWCGHLVWDAICGWAEEAFDTGRSVVYDFFALAGAVAIAVGIGYWATH